MNFETLKKEIEEISEISAKVPESFREKCFEILLTHLLRAESKQGHDDYDEAKRHKSNASQNKSDGDAAVGGAQKKVSAGAITLPAGLKAFMRRTSISPEEIEAIVMVEDGEFHFLKEPTNSKISQGQNEWALLLALRNGVLTGNLVVDAESVRSVVQDKGFYDKGNFAKNFKSPKYSAWYKNAMEAQGVAVGLSPEGEGQLATLIKAL